MSILTVFVPAVQESGFGTMPCVWVGVQGNVDPSGWVSRGYSSRCSDICVHALSLCLAQNSLDNCCPPCTAMTVASVYCRTYTRTHARACTHTHTRTGLYFKAAKHVHQCKHGYFYKHTRTHTTKPVRHTHMQTHS